MTISPLGFNQSATIALYKHGKSAFGGQKAGSSSVFNEQAFEFILFNTFISIFCFLGMLAFCLRQGDVPSTLFNIQRFPLVYSQSEWELMDEIDIQGRYHATTTQN